MYRKLEEIFRKPEPFEVYSADALWTDEHISKNMLKLHLDGSIDAASRNFEFIERSVSWITEHFGLGPGSRALDFGCGPGLYTNRFAEKGIRVTGIDFSVRSLEYARDAARSRNLEAEYISANYLEFDTGEKFDIVTMIMCDFSVLSPRERKLMLSKFGRLLKPGGKIILDVHSLHYFEEITESHRCERNYMDRFWSPEDYWCFVNSFKYEREKVIYNWLQCYFPDSLRKELEECGLSVIELLGDVAGKGYDPEGDVFAVIAGKPDKTG